MFNYTPTELLKAYRGSAWGEEAPAVQHQPPLVDGRDQPAPAGVPAAQAAPSPCPSRADPSISPTEAGAAPLPPLSPPEGCCAGARAFSDCQGSFCTQVWLSARGRCVVRAAGHAGLPAGDGLACRHTLHLKISSQP